MKIEGIEVLGIGVKSDAPGEIQIGQDAIFGDGHSAMKVVEPVCRIEQVETVAERGLNRRTKVNHRQQVVESPAFGVFVLIDDVKQVLDRHGDEDLEPVEGSGVLLFGTDQRRLGNAEAGEGARLFDDIPAASHLFFDW